MGVVPKDGMNPAIIRTKEGVHVLANDTHLSRWVEEQGRLDIAVGEISAFAHYIPKGGCVIDAGACLGDHAATYAQLVGPLGRVYAFEPHPDTFEALWLNFATAPNVSVYNYALGETAAVSHLTLLPNIGASYVGTEGPEISVLPLDRLTFPRLDFIHLDCEGMEVAVLRGGRNTLTRFRPVMVLEVNHGCLARRGQSEATLIQTLAELGYNWKELNPAHGPHSVQRDILCLPIQP